MVDVHTKKQRSYNMSRIKCRDTKPEVLLRKLLYADGARGYRVNYRLKGKPDVVFPKQKIAVFVDGCFWHKCPSCFIKPKSNNGYWDGKIENNIKRDKKISRLLKNNGIVVFRFWEHEIKENIEGCYETLVEMLNKRK